MDARYKRIIEAATFAPSGDNSQPWSFSVSGDMIELFMHPERDHALLNVKSGGTLIACGAALENMVIAARAESLTAELELQPVSDDTSLVARIRISGGEPAHEDERSLADCIRTRHTNRTAYATTALPPGLLEKLAMQANRFPPCRMTTAAGRDALARAGHAASAMEEVALRTKPLHALFFDSIMWSKEQNEAGEPGMYIRAMELPPPVRFLFKALKNWRLVSSLNALGFARIAAAGNAQVYASCGAMASFIVPDRSVGSMLAAGRCMQRVWLEAVRAGLAAQPLAGLLYVAASVSDGSEDLFDARSLSRIRDAQAVLRHVARAEGDEAVVMMLRLGTPLRPPTDYSRRKPPAIIER